MTTKILGNQITSYTIDTVQLSNTATAAFAKTLAPKVLYANVASNTFTVLDDTAVNVGGGYIVVTGAEFQSGATVLIDTTPASAVTYVNSTTLQVQVPTKSASSYNLYVVNPDGGVGIKVAGLTYSTNPSWVTASPLDNQLANTAFNVTLSATGASSYSVAAGSTLPAGTTLAANGYFSGTVSIGAQTTYTFSIVATDSELQDSSKTFQVTVTVDPPDPYFNYTTLLLQADNVSNNATNSSFVDSSNNAYAITATGTPVQGSQNPFGVGNWSNYFDGSSRLTSVPSGLSMGTSDFTIEAWVNPLARSGIASNITGQNFYGFGTDYIFYIAPNGTLGAAFLTGGSEFAVSSTATVPLNQWTHVAVTRSGSSFKLWINGVNDGTVTSSASITNNYAPVVVGHASNATGAVYFTGHISNVRIIKGNALYTSTFTPSTTPLTAVANTQLLTCQSNSFKDSSNTAFTVTAGGSPTVERFNPFGVNAIAYSSNTDTGSTYFNGSSDYLSLPNSTANLNGGSSDFTIDGWLYPTSSAQQNIFYLGGNTGTYAGIRFEINGSGTRPLQILATTDGSNWGLNYNAGSLQLNAWNHIVLCRSGNSWYIFINGVQAGSTQTLAGTLYAGSLNRIGAYDSGGAGGFFSGYMSNMRFIKGTALYTSAFTPPTTPAEPITNTQLLLLSKNAGIYDATMQNNIRTIGDAKVRTNVYKYGTGAMYFDGTTDYAVVPTTTNFGYGTGDFTIEFWMNLNSIVDDQSIISNLTSVSSVNPHLYFTQVNRLLIYQTNNATRISSSGSGALSASTWYHVALCRSSGSTKMFINGTQVGSTYTDANNYGTSAPLAIGTYWSAGTPVTTSTFNGYLDDIRITKGYARYTANFTPPTAVLPKK